MIRKFGFCALSAFALMISAMAAPSISSVTARQRYPWNGLVDISYTVTGASGNYKILVSAFDTNGNTNLPVRTVRVAGGTVPGNPVTVSTTDTKVIWDAAADLPVGFVADGITVSAQAYTMQTAGDGLYCIIDLSGGSSATSYPVSYLDAVPAGGWTDEYKTTKLVLRKLTPNSFMMGCRDTDWESRGYGYYYDGRENASNIDLHLVALTRPFFVGVYPITQKQYELVMGWNPSTYPGDMFPVDCVSYAMVRGGNWPSEVGPDAGGFVGKLRAKTGLAGIDLPTEAQWEYACRAGTGTSLNNGRNFRFYYGNYYCDYNNGSYDTAGDTSRYDPMAHVLRGFWETKGGADGTCAVGSYEPNNWGLYDCHGNVWEWCLDWYAAIGNTSATDPVGPTSGDGRVLRGGSYRSYLYECRSGYRGCHPSPDSASAGYGFRIVNCLP